MYLSLFSCTSVYIFRHSDESVKLDLDGQGGRKFLRVLLNLVMHNYPLLVSGALQLLFRHFSQRHEVLQAFQQVRSCFERIFVWSVTCFWNSLNIVTLSSSFSALFRCSLIFFFGKTFRPGFSCVAPL